MKQYRLKYAMHPPSEETGGLYMAEAPALPGCRAWGETSAEAYKHLQNVAAEFIASYEHHGDPLPTDVKAEALTEELVIAV